MMELLLEILAMGSGFLEAQVTFGGKFSMTEDGNYRWVNDHHGIDHTFASYRELDAYLWGYDFDPGWL